MVSALTENFIIGVRFTNGDTNHGIMTTDFDGKELSPREKIKYVVALVKKDLLGAQTVLVRVK